LKETIIEERRGQKDYRIKRRSQAETATRRRGKAWLGGVAKEECVDNRGARLVMKNEDDKEIYSRNEV
jgi:hypothetical protein